MAPTNVLPLRIECAPSFRFLKRLLAAVLTSGRHQQHAFLQNVWQER